MKPELLKSLKELLNDWLEEISTSDEWPDGLVHPNINEHMAQAAAAVFDATFESSKYTEKEIG